MVNIQWLSFLSFPANLWLFQCVDITPESEQSWNTMVRLNVRGWLVVIVWNCFVETGSSLGQTVSLTLTSVTSTTHSRDGASSPSFHRPGIPTFFFFKKKKKSFDLNCRHIPVRTRKMLTVFQLSSNWILKSAGIWWEEFSLQSSHY